MGGLNEALGEGAVAPARPLRVAVLGPGAIGAFVAVLLVRARHEVTLVGRSSPGVARLESFRVESDRHGAIEAPLALTAALGTPVDLLVVAVKAPALSDAIERIATRIAAPVVVPLLNGIEHMATLRACFPSVLAGTIGGLEAFRDGPRRTVVIGAGRIALAADAPSLAPALETAREAFAGAGLATTIGASEADVLWAKLARLCPVACVTTLARAPLGVVRARARWRTRLEGLVEECACIAAAAGHATTSTRIAGEIAALPDTLRTSLERDIAAGRPNELDAIAGAVRRRALALGIACPSLDTVLAEIEREHEWVADTRRRGFGP